MTLYWSLPITNIMSKKIDSLPAYHSLLSACAGKSIWTYNPSCNKPENCHSVFCSHNDQYVKTELGFTQSQMSALSNGLKAYSPSKKSYYVTYSDIEKLLETGKEDVRKIEGKRYEQRSYRQILSQKMCTCGALPHCRKIHSIDEILDIFRDDSIRKFYQYANIKTAFPESKLSSKVLPNVREKSLFLCDGKNNVCTMNLDLYEYNVSLLHKYDNHLDYPICHITCNFCRQVRSVSIYI